MRLHVLVLVAVTLVGGVAPLGAQSLGEIARQEAERRKALAVESKVYTDKDLPHVPPATAKPAPAPASPASDPSTAKEGAAEPPAAAPEAEATKDQAYWSGRMKALQDGLAKSQTYAAALQSQINALTTDFVNRDDPAQREVISRDRQSALDALKRLNADIDDTREAIADVYEEARRAGVPPGWLR